MARLPRALKRREPLKLVLWTLADHCNDDGLNAFPGAGTIASEHGFSIRSVDKYLDVLDRAGLISEQAPPGRRTPRTWQLHLPAIRALVEPAALSRLESRRADSNAKTRNFDHQDQKNRATATSVQGSVDPEREPAAATPPRLALVRQDEKAKKRSARTSLVARNLAAVGLEAGR